MKVMVSGYRNLNEKREAKKPLDRRRRRWEDNIEMKPKGI
jgi:hypothetical protein